MDPTTLLGAPGANGVIASYERPSKDFALVAIGEAGRVEVEPGAGPCGARAGAAELLRGASKAGGPSLRSLRPRLIGGFAFEGRHEPGAPWQGFGCGSLVLPRLMFVRDGDVSGVVLAPGVDASEAVDALALAERRALEAGERASGLRAVSGIDRERYRAGVRAIASEVQAGAYEKVVLATSQELEADADIDVGLTLERLRAAYPECHLFSVHAGDATFLGASPELLVNLQGGRVSTLGLAGSARRGATPQEDARVGRALLQSAKDRLEHETVVRAIREALAEVTEILRAPDQPRLRKLRNIQHLATDITGRVLRGVDVLELVQRLHPTPAVCGLPRQAAQRLIAAIEGFERGWYAGPIGWMDAAGEGEFAVGLRVALVRRTRAWLFAGNGIMGDSDPDAELAEVELKFRPLAEALLGTPSALALPR
jgi:isochorismate synthase